MNAIAQASTHTAATEKLLPLPEHLQGRGMTRCLDLFRKQIRQARQRVRDGAGCLARLYEGAPFQADQIEEALAADLAERLLTITTRTMVLELNVARMEGVLEGDTPEQRFEHFLNRLCEPEVAQRLLDEYPVLVEQVENRLARWSDYSLEFLRHLCEDWETLRETFFDSHLGELTHIRMGAGDTHRGGRSVILLEFAQGTRLVYKPRSLAVDGHFNGLLNWLNEQGAEPSLRPLKSVDGGRHGWAEFVSRAGCETIEEVTRFYQRQGAYLAVLYALEATDFHAENLIAAGEHPMLIDLEALFHPRFSTDYAVENAYGALGYSALRVGLLPARYWFDENNPGLDMSGMGSAAGQLIPRGVPQWECADTDEMRLVKKSMEMPGADNRPVLKGKEADALHFADAIVEGFKRMYGVLLRHRKGFQKMVSRFAQDELRVIVRATQSYATVLHESYHPDMLRNQADRNELFARLAGMEEFREAENSDLRRGDVPLFTTRPEVRDVWTSDGVIIKEHLAESGLTLVNHRIEQLSETDLERQLWIVKASLATLSSVTDGPAKRKAQPPASRAVDEAELLAAASGIGDRLQKLALGGEEVSWIGLTPQNEKIWTLTALEGDFYDGLPGVIFFLAYLGEITGEACHTLLARSALKSLRRQVAEWRDLKLTGGFTGWGGLIYAFSHLGALWCDEELLKDAERHLDKAAGCIENDEYLDVTGGVAGLGLALQSFYAATGSEKAISAARKCGNRLLSAARMTDEGFGWFRQSISKRPLTGFAHGSAGIGYALLKMASWTGEKELGDAGRWAFEYERGCFSKEHKNWPDFRENRQQSYMSAWCHGAPGIGLSRLGALRHSKDPWLREEIDVALETTVREGLGGCHCLCHGDMGNLETLVYAAEVFRDPHWLTEAKCFAGGLLDQAKQSGWVCGNTLGVESPGLMTGIAGIGYELLRLAAGERLPSVLALEPPRTK